MDGDSSRRIRTRCTRDLFPGSDARVYSHALGRSGGLAGMCHADLRDQPSSLIRMYRSDVFARLRQIRRTKLPFKREMSSREGRGGITRPLPENSAKASAIRDIPLRHRCAVCGSCFVSPIPGTYVPGYVPTPLRGGNFPDSLRDLKWRQRRRSQATGLNGLSMGRRNGNGGQASPVDGFGESNEAEVYSSAAAAGSSSAVAGAVRPPAAMILSRSSATSLGCSLKYRRTFSRPWPSCSSP